MATLACAEVRAPGTLFALGDSYAWLSVPALEEVARGTGCQAGFDARFARSGWTAAGALAAEPSWRPALESARAPVVVYTIFGLNDMFSAGGSQDPERAARDMATLVERVSAAAPQAQIVQLTYDDIWDAAPREVVLGGSRYWLRTGISPILDEYYAALPRNPNHTLVDVRGWLGDSLWSDDGVHMTRPNYAAQARLLWEREFADRVGCGA